MCNKRSLHSIRSKHPLIRSDDSFRSRGCENVSRTAGIRESRIPQIPQIPPSVNRYLGIFLFALHFSRKFRRNGSENPTFGRNFGRFWANSHKNLKSRLLAVSNKKKILKSSTVDIYAKGQRRKE